MLARSPLGTLESRYFGGVAIGLVICAFGYFGSREPGGSLNGTPKLEAVLKSEYDIFCLWLSDLARSRFRMSMEYRILSK